MDTDPGYYIANAAGSCLVEHPQSHTCVLRTDAQAGLHEDQPGGNCSGILLNASASFTDEITAVGSTGSASLRFEFAVTSISDPGTVNKLTVAWPGGQQVLNNLSNTTPPQIVEMTGVDFGSPFLLTATLSTRCQNISPGTSTGGVATAAIVGVEVLDSLGRTVGHARVAGSSGRIYLGSVPGAVIRVDSSSGASPLYAAGALPDWSDALPDLRTAIELARLPGGPREIHVAEGTYTADTVWGTPFTGADASSQSFRLRSGVSILGGFAGMGAQDPNLRDPVGTPTILSGDLAGDDNPDDPWANRADNTEHIVVTSGTDSTAVLDGVIISRGEGHATGSAGAGMLIYANASPTIRGCRFEYNRVGYRGAGGAILIRGDSHPVFEDCTIVNNRALLGEPDLANDGGAVRLESEATITLLGCEVSDNQAYEAGGAIVGGKVIAVGTTFARNRTYAGQGGATNGRLDCTGCLFVDNYSQGNGGGAAVEPWSSIVDTVFQDNRGGAEGGGVQAAKGRITIERCVFTGNSAGARGAGAIVGKGSTVSESHFEANTQRSATTGGRGGILELDGSTADSAVADCIFRDNVCNAANTGALGMTSHSSATRCDVIGNQGQGIRVWGGSNVIDSCRVLDNTGSGISQEAGSFTVLNSLIAGNQLHGLEITANWAVVHDSTIAGNARFGIRNGASGGAQVDLWNSIVASNGSGSYKSANADLRIEYSLIEEGFAGEGNVSGDPLFADSVGPDGAVGSAQDNDYRLAPGSPAIDSGNSTVVPAGINEDLDRASRFVDALNYPDSGLAEGSNAVVDMGAYEAPATILPRVCPGDVNGDGATNAADFTILSSNYGASSGATRAQGDLNSDGAVDVADFVILVGDFGCSEH